MYRTIVNKNLKERECYLIVMLRVSVALEMS